MKWLLLGLFVAGMTLAVIGWFFDRATKFNFLLNIISSDYVYGINALDVLAENDKRGFGLNHPGFTVLLQRWPEYPKERSVVFIRRSIAYMAFGARVKNDFDLILLDANKNEIKPRWSEAEARNLLGDELNRKLFRLGTIVFFVGIAISFTSGLLQFLKGKTKL